MTFLFEPQSKMALSTSTPHKCIADNLWFWRTSFGWGLHDRSTSYCGETVEDLYSLCAKCLKKYKERPGFPSWFSEDGRIRYTCVRGDPDYKKDQHPSYQLAAQHIPQKCTNDVFGKGGLCGKCCSILEVSAVSVFLKHFYEVEHGKFMARAPEYVYPIGPKRENIADGPKTKNTADETMKVKIEIEEIEKKLDILKRREDMLKRAAASVPPQG